MTYGKVSIARGSHSDKAALFQPWSDLPPQSGLVKPPYRLP